MPSILCKPKRLPIEKIDAASRRAIEVNPANANEQRRVARIVGGRRGGGRRIAVVIGRRWPATGVRLTVSFMDSPSTPLRARNLKHMNAWGEAANVLFAETSGTGEVRIARLDTPVDMSGYWSYVGTEILEIEHDQPTLNLEGFTMKTSESEFRRVVRWLDSRGSRGTGPDAAVEEGHHGHERERPALDHVLPAAGQDHEGRQGGAGRRRHQSARSCLRGLALSEGSAEGSRATACAAASHSSVGDCAGTTTR